MPVRIAMEILRIIPVPIPPVILREVVPTTVEAITPHRTVEHTPAPSTPTTRMDITRIHQAIISMAFINLSSRISTNKMFPPKRSIIITALGITPFVVFCLLVWPTRYRYNHIKIEANDFPIRIDRFTGKTEIFRLSGWRDPDEQNRPKPELEIIQAQDLSKLDGRGEVTSNGDFNLNLYNGSNRTIAEITVLVTVNDSKGIQVLSRQYRLQPKYSNAEPLSSNLFQTQLGFSIGSDQSWNFTIVAGKAIRG